MNEVVMANDQILALERLLESQGVVNLCVLKAQTTDLLRTNVRSLGARNQ